MALLFIISVQTQNFSFKPPSSLGPTSNHSGRAFVPTFLYPKNGSSKLTVLKRHGSPSESVQKFSSLCSCHFFYLRNYPASLNTLSEFINKQKTFHNATILFPLFQLLWYCCLAFWLGYNDKRPTRRSARWLDVKAKNMKHVNDL